MLSKILKIIFKKHLVHTTHDYKMDLTKDYAQLDEMEKVYIKTYDTDVKKEIDALTYKINIQENFLNYLADSKSDRSPFKY